MTKLRVVFIVSLVILGVLLAFAWFRPLAAPDEEYSEVQRAHLLQTEDEWIIEFDIINREGKDTNYIVTVVSDGKQYSEKVLIPDGKQFTYIHHLSCAQITSGCATFTICEEGEAAPIEEVTYYLK